MGCCSIAIVSDTEGAMAGGGLRIIGENTLGGRVWLVVDNEEGEYCRGRSKAWG